MSETFPAEATRELLAILPLLNRIVAADVRREAGEETTLPQFRVLSELAAGSITLSVLAKRRRVSLQSMSELVQTLVLRGWIEREPDPTDRRTSILHLTESGRSHFERAEAQTLRHLTPLLAQLAPEELQAIRTALFALRRVLAQEEQDGDSEITNK